MSQLQEHVGLPGNDAFESLTRFCSIRVLEFPIDRLAAWSSRGLDLMQLMKLD